MVAEPSSKPHQLVSQPDSQGIATRLTAERLRAAGIAIEPLLRNAGLSASQISNEKVRVGAASQIKFLSAAATALDDPLLGFKIARDGDLRQIGPLYYVATSSATLGEALARAQRYSSIVNAGFALRVSESGSFTVALRYVGVPRHSDRHQMECLITVVIRLCRTLTGCNLNPTIVRLAHRRIPQSSELEKYFGCRIDFGADRDEVVLDQKAAKLFLVGADPYLNDILLKSCEQALAPRRSAGNSLRSVVENAITPLLPHGKARLEVVARTLGMSSRTLSRKLTKEGLTFGEILNQLRSDLALHYLKERELSISQIAWLVGYQGVGTFSHSCKRWTGDNPKTIRDKLVRTVARADEPPAPISGH